MDGREFAQIVEQTKVREFVFRRCYAILHNYPDALESAEDVTQIVFMKAWQKLHAFRDEANLCTWLYRIASNAAVDHIRTKKRRQSISLDCIDVCEPPLARMLARALEVNHTESTYVSRLTEKKERRILEAALSKMSPTRQSVVRLRMTDATLREISGSLSISLAAAKWHLGLAVSAFKQALIDGI